MPEKEETRTYTLTAVPSVLRRIERLFALMAKCGRWGASRSFSLWFDGDGADRLEIQRSVVRNFDGGAAKAIESGYGVIYVNGPGFLGMSGGNTMEPKKRWNDNGKELPLLEELAEELVDGQVKFRKPGELEG